MARQQVVAQSAHGARVQRVEHDQLFIAFAQPALVVERPARMGAAGGRDKRAGGMLGNEGGDDLSGALEVGDAGVAVALRQHVAFAFAAPRPADVDMRLCHDAGDDVIVLVLVQHMFEILDPAQQGLGKSAVHVLDRVLCRHHHIGAGTIGDQLGHRHGPGGERAISVCRADHL